MTKKMTRTEARSKGGKSVPPSKRTFSTYPSVASTAGSKGGHAAQKTLNAPCLSCGKTWRKCRALFRESMKLDGVEIGCCGECNHGTARLVQGSIT